MFLKPSPMSLDVPKPLTPTCSAGFGACHTGVTDERRKYFQKMGTGQHKQPPHTVHPEDCGRPASPVLVRKADYRAAPLDLWPALRSRLSREGHVCTGPWKLLRQPSTSVFLLPENLEDLEHFLPPSSTKGPLGDFSVYCILLRECNSSTSYYVKHIQVLFAY